MAREVTREQAEAVMAIVDQRYGAWYADLPANSPDRPHLVENWEPWWGPEGRTVPFAILWESGPDEWAYRFNDGGFDEELALGVAEFVGQERTREMAKAGEFTEKPAELPKGVYIECGTSFILCLYPA